MSKSIGPPPGFGPNGAWPEVRSEPLVIASWSLDRYLWQVIAGKEGAREVDVLIASKDAHVPKFRKMYKQHVKERGLAEVEMARRGDPLTNFRDQFGRGVLDQSARGVSEQYWEREDPPTQLPPGGSVETSTSLRMGLTNEQLDELARSVGVSSKMGSRARLNAALSQKTATKFTVSREQTVTQTLTLTNPSDASYRLFALWHLVNRISILSTSDLILSYSAARTSSPPVPSWSPRLTCPQETVEHDSPAFVAKFNHSRR